MQKYRNRLIAGFAIAILIYAVYLFIVETRTDGGAFRHIAAFPMWLFAPLVILQVLAFFFRWVEWHYYLGVIGAQDKISVFDSMVLQLAGFTMAVSPGKAGELLKSVVLKAKTGTEISKSAPVVLAERVVDGIAVILMMALAVAFGGDATSLQDWQRNSILASAGILITGLIVVQIKPLAYFFLNVLPHIPLVRRLHGGLTDFYESSREVFHLRHVVPMVGVGFGVYGCSALTMFLILVGFGQEPSVSLFLQSTIIAGVSAAVGALSGSPNGAGVTEGSIQWILMQSFGYGAGLALAAGLLHGLFNRWLRVFMGMIAGFVFRRRLFVPAFEAELAAVEQEQHVDPQPATVA
ncbi:MAG: lysylphosphatidylglycerol synthase transmembrane domain-containing protein [Chloroflexota bacterium]